MRLHRLSSPGLVEPAPAPAGLASSVVTGSSCPDCGHVWTNHAGALLSVTRRVECIVEEDNGDRDDTAVCPLVPPDLAHVPVGGSLVARFERRPLRGDRVLIEDSSGGRWALLRPPFTDPREVDRLLSRVRSDMASMPITEFRDKYRHLME